MKKKILFYYTLFFTGGTEHAILTLVKKLYNEFDIIVAYDNEESVDTVLNEIGLYAKVINLNKIDNIYVDKCIICSYRADNWIENFFTKVISKHYYYWSHILLFETFPQLEFEDFFMEKIEKYICVSESVKNNLTARYLNIKDKCEVVKNYLPVEDIIEKSNQVIEQVKENNKLNLITVGRISKDKGFRRMKWLCDVLDNNNIEYNWIVVGTAFRKEVLEEIQGDFKNNSNVHFIGYKENVYPYIKNMDYLVLLTDREACCLVIDESLILGVPCLVTNFTGVEKQIIDKENGIILDMNNENGSYGKRIQDIMSLKEELKNNVKKYNYDKENIMDYWENFLND